MPWDRCKFYGDPTTPAELFSKAQYWDFETNDSLTSESQNWFISGTGWFKGGGAITTTDVLGACDAVVGKSDDYPCMISLPFWDGGLDWLRRFDGETTMAEDFADYLETGGMVFEIVGKVAGLSSFAVKQFALNDYKNDMSGVKDKMQVAKNQYDKAMPEVDVAGKALVSLGGNLEGLAGNLQSIKNSLADQWIVIESVLTQLGDLNSSLASATNALNLGKEHLNYANNRSNFPAGIPGSIMQRNARIQANAEIANASTKIVDLEGKIYVKGEELKTDADVYNKTGELGKGVSQAILDNQTAIKNMKSVYDSKLAPAQSAVNLRNGALEDIPKAQNTLASKLDDAVVLAQVATGASGVSQALKYISTGEHLRATGAGLNTGIDLGSSYLPESLNINPFIPLAKTVVSVGFDTLQTGGNVRGMTENLGEALVGYKSSQKIFNSVEGALTIMPQDPYTAWQILAIETHEGVGVLGKIATTASPFMGAIPMTAVLPALIPIAQSASSGAVSTAVEVGQKMAIDEFWSAKLGTGRPSGIFMLFVGGPFASAFYGPSAKIKNGINQALGSGEKATNENTALAIQRMAMTGMEKVTIPDFRFDVGMRPVEYPKNPNFAGDVVE